MTKKLLLALAALLVVVPAVRAQDYEYDPTSSKYDPDYLSTYTIIGRDPVTGELGIGVASRVLAVGRNGSSFKGGVGVIVHQASSDPYYGRIGLEMLDAGLDPQEVLGRLVRSDLRSESRQVAIIDAQGRTAAFTGGGPLGLAEYSHPQGPNETWKGHKCGVDYCAQANTMLSRAVVDNLAASFEASKNSGKSLAERLIDALDAGNAAGADVRGQQSAALFIVKKLSGAGGYSDVGEDLRVNDHPQPIVELRRLFTLRQSGAVIADANRMFEAGQREQGLQALMALRDKIPGSDAVWIALAGQYVRMDRKADALAAIKTAVELNPWNARTLNGGLPTNEMFASLRADPEWIRIMSVWPLQDKDGLHPNRLPAGPTVPRPGGGG
jgi:uncharacterized Ntn-hydrolase superfamily protein